MGILKDSMVRSLAQLDDVAGETIRARIPKVHASSEHITIYPVMGNRFRLGILKGQEDKDYLLPALLTRLTVFR